MMIEIEITGGKVPKSDLRMYQIWSNRGDKFWGMECLEYIGSIINGVMRFENASPKEKGKAENLWEVMSITEKF